MNLPHLSVLALGAVLALVATPASAASAENQAAADVLFKEAKALATANDCEHAIPKFVESQRLDPSAGTLLNVGNCYEKLGKLASAYGAFREAEVLARTRSDDFRQGEAARRAEAIAPQLAKLAIVVPLPIRVPGVEVKRDGALVGEGQWGSALPVDPGQHTIEATAPGYKPWSTVMRVEGNGAAQIEVPLLEKSPEGPTEARPDSSVQKPLGFAAIGVGAAGLVVGAITLGLDASKHASIAKQCPMGLCPTSLHSDVDTYHTLGIASSSSLIIGGALVATGVIVVLVAPKTNLHAAGISPVVGPGFAGISGSF
jgi:hypothetical protein